MKRRRALIPPRRRIFLGCEGESEQSYGSLLARVAEERKQHIALQVVLLRPGGGDPLGLVVLAADLSRRAEERRGPFFYKAIFLDRDKLGETPDRDKRLFTVADANQLHLVWQDPTHEAFLLRHLANCQNLRPRTAALATSELCKRWPGYRKPMTVIELAERIGAAEVQRACTVTPELEELLVACGLRWNTEVIRMSNERQRD
jgi:hypothetical protein